MPGAVKIDWHTDLQDQTVRDYIDKDRFAELCASKGICERHDGRLLRRQEQLVGLLRLLGLQAVRPRRLPDHERRPQALGAGRSRPGRAIPSHNIRARAMSRPGSRSHRFARFATK